MVVLRWIIPLILVATSLADCNHDRPPIARYGSDDPYDKEEASRVAMQIDELDEDDKQNPWELSGLFEGDIVLDKKVSRNGALKEKYRWTKGIVPYYIAENNFSDEEKQAIRKGLRAIAEQSCIKFRRYRKEDTSWVVFRSNSSGCWSYVGMRPGGQTINLQAPRCIKHGTVIHEALHALGFWHQHSSRDRDKYVRILWENIIPSKKHNFKKCNCTDFGVAYDYGSIMHYTSMVFSKNGKPTIKPLQEALIMGQNFYLSTGDALKLRRMYKRQCSRRRNTQNWEPFSEHFSSMDDIFG
ncbi:seminal metalloprotease 1-like [Topomyia yanbarensis]|uniref:seminal metalloprotease 1-like n=1 Tax=Topomyia yanbarensis TaxID=2498891 RepID=UPI00273BC219|nr:seminal metalloprotease 1-like [Topomyia yanbarensis]